MCPRGGKASLAVRAPPALTGPRTGDVMTNIFSSASVLLRLAASSKKQVLQEMSRSAGRVLRMPERRVFDVILERERLGSTALGRGVAIPHAKLAELDRVVCVFATLARPVSFDAVDDLPVDLVFMLLAPEQAGAEHLRALARVSRMFRDPDMCEKLRGCTSDDAVLALFGETAARAA